MGTGGHQRRKQQKAVEPLSEEFIKKLKEKKGMKKSCGGAAGVETITNKFAIGRKKLKKEESIGRKKLKKEEESTVIQTIIPSTSLESTSLESTVIPSTVIESTVIQTLAKKDTPGGKSKFNKKQESIQLESSSQESSEEDFENTEFDEIMSDNEVDFDNQDFDQEEFDQEEFDNQETENEEEETEFDQQDDSDADSAEIKAMFSDSDQDDDQELEFEKEARLQDEQERIVQQEAHDELLTNIQEREQLVLPDLDNAEQETAVAEAQDISIVQQRIGEIIRVLNNFKELSDPEKSRSDYVNVLINDLGTYYGYNEYLATLFYHLFPLNEVTCLNSTMNNQKN